jgi:hypothetical protein
MSSPPTADYGYSYILTDTELTSGISGTFTVTTPSSVDNDFTNNEEVVLNGGPFDAVTATYYGYWQAPNGAKWPIINDFPGLVVFTNVDYSDSGTFGTVNAAASLPICLLFDARIAIPGGVKAIDELSIGDEVLTPSGVRRVKFIGHSTRVLPDLRATGKMPIRINAGALAHLGPTREIHCSPSHAFLIGGCLVEAQALINGSTIQQVETWDEFSITYYSIELEEHSLVWANGLPTETYFANMRGKGFSRESWDNYADYVALYGEGEPMKELELPRIPFARQLPAEIRELAGVVDPAAPGEIAARYALT